MTVHRAKGHRRERFNYHKGCGMQETEVVLGVLRERGRKGLPLTQLYRQMFNRNLYLAADRRIYQPGVDDAGAQPGNRRRHVRGPDR